MPFLERDGDGVALLAPLPGWEEEASDERSLAVWSRRFDLIRFVIFHELPLMLSTAGAVLTYKK